MAIHWFCASLSSLAGDLMDFGGGAADDRSAPAAQSYQQQPHDFGAPPAAVDPFAYQQQQQSAPQLMQQQQPPPAAPPTAFHEPFLGGGGGVDPFAHPGPAAAVQHAPPRPSASLHLLQRGEGCDLAAVFFHRPCFSLERFDAHSSSDLPARHPSTHARAGIPLDPAPPMDPDTFQNAWAVLDAVMDEMARECAFLQLHHFFATFVSARMILRFVCS